MALPHQAKLKYAVEPEHFAARKRSTSVISLSKGALVRPRTRIESRRARRCSTFLLLDRGGLMLRSNGALTRRPRCALRVTLAHGRSSSA